MKLPPETPTREMLQARVALCEKRVYRAQAKVIAAQNELIAAMDAVQDVSDALAACPEAQHDMAAVWAVGS